MRLMFERIHSIKGHDVDERQLAAFFHIRETVSQLKEPERRKEIRENFAAFARSCDEIYYLLDEARQDIVAFFMARMVEPEGPVGPVLLQVDYMYTLPRARGDKAFSRMFGLFALRTLWRMRKRECWCVGIGVCPLSYRFAKEFGESCGTTFDGNLPPNITAALMEMATEQYGECWDPHSHCVDVEVIPPPCPERALARFSREPWWDEYHRVCPHWQRGYGIVAACKGSVIELLLSLGKRKLRKLASGFPQPLASATR